MHKWMACVVAALALSGCGGSGGAVQSTPVPAKTPITQGAAPPALAPITTGTLADALKGSAEFRTGSTEVIYDAGKQTVSSRNKAHDSPTSIHVHFDAATGKYSVSNIIGTAHQFPQGFDQDSGPPYALYGQNAVDGVRRLSILTPSPANAVIALTYTSFGVWQFDSSDRGNVDPRINDYHFFYFGIPTADAALPRTGTANYSGVAQGVLFEPQDIYRLQGTMTLSTDFASGAVGTAIALSGTSQANGQMKPLPALNAVAMISADRNAFVGTLTAADDSLIGSIQGAFFGPAAEEVGYSFAVNSRDLTRIGGGVAVGKR